MARTGTSSGYRSDRCKKILQARRRFLDSRRRDWMKECSVLGATSKILAIEALETFLPNSIWISASFPIELRRAEGALRATEQAAPGSGGRQPLSGPLG